MATQIGTGLSTESGGEASVDSALPSILLVNAAEQVWRDTALQLGAAYALHCVPDPEAARRYLQGHSVDVVLLDILYLGSEDEGFELLATLGAQYPEIPVLVMSDRREAAKVVRAMKLGAMGYITKDTAKAELDINIQTALELRASRIRVQIREEGEDASIVGNSPAICGLRQDLKRFAGFDGPLLIEGESGTGKQLCARALHSLGPRKEEPFLVVNCAAFTPIQLESELFGHEFGAFEGATRRQVGRIQEAGHGVIYLDEIARMGLETQQKLKSAITRGRFRPLGSSQVVPLRARIVAGSSRDLVQELREGRFHGPLLLLLRVMQLHIPPLRERLEDVEPLTHHLIYRKAREMKLSVPTLELGALRLLQGQSWPGNARELGTVIENALVHLKGNSLGPADFKLLKGCSFEGQLYKQAWASAERNFQRAYYRGLLRAAKGVVKRASELSGLPRQTIYRHLKKLGIRKEDYRRDS